MESAGMYSSFTTSIKEVNSELIYFPEKRLGSGSYGQVYRGVLKQINEHVAVKKMASTEFKQLQSEISILKIGRHDNLVHYFAVWVQQDWVYIVMELCSGTLEDLIKRPERNVARPGPMELALLQTAVGVSYLHSKGIIHRDIKPVNILVSMPKSRALGPVIKIADFGLSKLKSGDASLYSKSNSAMGTPSWAAPELLDGRIKQVQFSADVFSLGCVFGYALTNGHHPFGNNPVSRPHNILMGIIEWSTDGEDAIKNPEIESMIRSMIEKTPGRRPGFQNIVQTLTSEINKNQEADVADIKFNEHNILGEIGYSTVCLGTYQNSKVAVKRILHARYKGFASTARMLLTISHPNIVKYVKIQETVYHTLIAMELCATNLRDWVLLLPAWQLGSRYNTRDPGWTGYLMHQTCRGLEFLHSNGIVHRNIKPRNVLISICDESRVWPFIKLADIGLGEPDRDQAINYNRSGWEAPESLMMERFGVQFDEYRADIFSLGCVFGYALTGGHHPFGDNIIERLNNILKNEKSIEWSSESSMKPKEMKRMIGTMINNNPENRPSLLIVTAKLLQLRQRRLLDLWDKDAEPNKRSLEELQSFVDDGIELNFKDELGRNLLMLVLQYVDNRNPGCANSQQQQRNGLKILLSEATIPLININDGDQKSCNALFHLCHYYGGNDIANVARLLIERGIDVNALSFHGATSLYEACRKSNNKNLIQLLLERGAKPDNSCWYYSRALHVLVANYKQTDICDAMQLLIAAGADVNATDACERNALLILCAHNAKHPKLKEAISFLIGNNVEINHVDSSGKNALLHICCKSRVVNTHGIVKLLLHHDIDVNARIASNGSVDDCFLFYDSFLLLCRCYQGDDLVDILRTLLANGADIFSETKTGRNALHLVCDYYGNLSLWNVIAFLIEKEVNAFAKDAAGHDAIYYLKHGELSQIMNQQEHLALQRMLYYTLMGLIPSIYIYLTHFNDIFII